jgi:hypothetical protein
MAASVVDTDSLLAIDVGTVTTRAVLFDIVEGRYRLLGVGQSLSTYDPPLKDIGHCVRHAIDQLQKITGRIFIDVDGSLITPSTPEGTGVDVVVATISAGRPLKVVVAGLLEDISLESARNLAASTYSQVVDTISMNDHRKIEAKTDAILHTRPDLIIVAGGTKNGASKSVLKLLDPIGLACFLLPEEERPDILYAGNDDVADEVDAILSEYASVHIAPNIRPTLEKEQLRPAQVQLRELFRMKQVQENPGVSELNKWASGHIMPSTFGFGRVVRFFGQIYESTKGVLGLDLGASSVSVSVAFAGDLQHKVYSQLGMGSVLPNLLNYTSLSNISRWLWTPVPESDLRAYIHHKSIYPASLPVTEEELSIEQALAREILRTALKGARKSFPVEAARARPELMPWFEPIIASGSVLTNAPSRGQSLLMLLDALEPTGITTLVLDQHNLLPGLGAAAEFNPLLSVQAFETGALLNLGTIIAPVGKARRGTTILRVKITFESGEEKKIDIKQGSLEVIPLPPGKSANLHLRPLHRYDIGMGGPGRGGGLSVKGGELGVVVDARGRPLQLPGNRNQQQELIRSWLGSLKRK